MLSGKRGASIISIVLCAVAFAFITAAVVVAKNNDAAYKAQELKKQMDVVDNAAYVKVYTVEEIEAVTRQAYADSYLAYYDGEVTLEGLEALVIGKVMEKIPHEQVENFKIFVYADGVTVEKI